MERTDSDTSRQRRNAIIALSIAIFFLLLPFVNKPYHIDDPFYIWTGQHILDEPLDFYGYSINWSSVEESAAAENKNPPLVSYFMAMVGLAVGWREWTMHLAFILPAVGVGIGTFLVATRFCDRPLLAAALSVAMPAFLVSSTNVMAEIVMLCFYVWAIFLWMAGLEEDRREYLAGAVVCIAGSTLSKYFGLSLLPLLLVYSVLQTRKLGRWAWYLGAALALIFIYELWTIRLYGFGLLGEAGKFAATETGEVVVPRDTRMFVGLAFTGGCMLAPLLLVPMAATWRWNIPGLIAGGYFFFVAYNYPGVFPETVVHEFRDPDWRFILHFTLFSMAGVATLMLPVWDLWRSRDTKSLLLMLWVMGTFAFAAQVNWTTNARALVPMAPAIGILLVRALEYRYEDGAFPWKRVSALGGTVLIVSLLLCVGDYSLAAASQRAAYKFRDELPEHDGQVWFTGHWGFQYYMEEWGAKPVNLADARVKAGDVVIEPVNNTSEFLSFDFVGQGTTTDFEVNHVATTWNPWRRAGFYSNKMGSLPYAFGRIPDEVYNVYLVNRDTTLELE